ncbi:hypothetical protein AGABI1DRAFT_92596 [Agaricus bisporus var. burnettii JB137-S8]|uniref:Uncharacterized protein n=1 Tax=Agaricus bisporus var. burnettii (strain JB137-S8 / ATCC MYA-4627 / FGSC 10392) TaxID=597362 RepID=K5WS73_AGABU|nr:uncharacterized protein AGABI1DRAFT_92596 [Agaricus bisporus var. burnettii JB137-S8]EKM78251.1 hypothetical protein AGABI1DRAFT_92596 [Agaricus bisporus var. burnettii JB137-S8]
MFLCITGVWAFSWTRLLRPNLINEGSATSLYINTKLDQGSGSLNPGVVGRAVLFVAASKLSDAILTYRLWIITRKSMWMMSFPILRQVTCVALIIIYANNEIVSMQWVLVLICLSVCLNVYFTGSILYRVKKLGTLVRFGGGDILKAIVIIVESAAIYTIWLIVLIIANITHADAMGGVLSNGVAHIAGIVSMLVNVRVGLNWAWDGHPDSNTFSTQADIELRLSR